MRALTSLLVLACTGSVLLGACDRFSQPGTSKDDARAVQLMRYHGCGTCHVIPGVPSAKGLVGPALGGIRQRSYIGGVLTNTPDNLVRWIHHPREIAPKTAMPDVGVSEAEARLMAAYLYAR